MAYYIPTVWKSGETRPPCLPPNCAHAGVASRNDHGAGVDSGLSFHFGLEQEPESIF